MPSLMLKSCFLFSDLAVKAVQSENKKGFSTSEKAQITRNTESPGTEPYLETTQLGLASGTAVSLK